MLVENAIDSGEQDDLQPLVFGQFLRRIRERKGWSQEDLAFLLKRDRGWLSRVEHNRRLGYLPPPDVVFRLSEVLHVPVARLVLSSYGLSHLDVTDDPGSVPQGLDVMVLTVENSAIDADLKHLLIGCIDAVAELHGHRQQMAAGSNVAHDDHDGHDGRNENRQFER